LTRNLFSRYTVNKQVASTYTISDVQTDLLSSREVEGNGPTKPGNPPANVQEGCQFRRNDPQDEGERDITLKPLNNAGVFLYNLHMNTL